MKITRPIVTQIHGGNLTPPTSTSPHPSWFSLNNSETVKDLTLTLIRDIRDKFQIPNLTQSLDIGQNSDRDISDFWISGQSFL